MVLGRVTNGVIVLSNGPILPEGTLVEVMPLDHEPGSPAAIRGAMEAEPHLSAEDVAELQRAIAAGKRAPADVDPFAES